MYGLLWQTDTVLSTGSSVHMYADCSPLPGLPWSMQPCKIRVFMTTKDVDTGRWELSMCLYIENDGSMLTLQSVKPVTLRGVRSVDDAKRRAEKAIHKYTEKLHQFTAFICEKTEGGF